ncbi:hypothetical protein HYC85_000548 [Camellia sinensis]|uniref:Uncharacterized protein n=1 Tax=Camellia sinensis TaxID=4442 RepID=A0A7J7I331_CAMSI|nr:hypothetical protein HYC85_000548 [Camellia sinensis]
MGSRQTQPLYTSPLSNYPKPHTNFVIHIYTLHCALQTFPPQTQPHNETLLPTNQHTSTSPTTQPPSTQTNTTTTQQIHHTKTTHTNTHVRFNNTKTTTYVLVTKTRNSHLPHCYTVHKIHIHGT